MKYLYSTIGILLTLTAMPACVGAAGWVRHDLAVVLYPNEHRFTAHDVITVPAGLLPEPRFLLHMGLSPSSPTPGVKIVLETERSGTVPLQSLTVSLSPGQSTFALDYGGSINHPLAPYGKEQARGFQQTPGIISAQGVYLAGSSFWYPSLSERLLTFTLQVELPTEWDAVSQGERSLHVGKGDTRSVRWTSSEVHEEIHLIAAPFREYSRRADKVDAMVFLRTPDEGLATKYLDATVRYLAMYEDLIGPYPYGKFALVENFWETGFGMASFTLLGPAVIRFPFILHSSYPHEILHNWWGNCVFPDYDTGNWSEGLTAYLSDHLIKEMRGHGVAYRQETLQKYADYVSGGRDFPLTQFRSRHSTSSEAVGYGKSLMFFHMLRQELGSETFVMGLQDFFRKNRFRLASFDDVRRSFEKVSARELKPHFDQWVTRAGAPELQVGRAKARAEKGGYVLMALLEQVQPEAAYILRVPVAVTMHGQQRPYQTVVLMEKKQLELKLHVPARPLRLDVDPEFDLFRRLDRDEIPPALTQAFGSKKMLILLPSTADKDVLAAFRELSHALSRSGPDEVQVKLDSEVKELPLDRAVTLLGWENQFLSEIVTALSEYDVSISEQEVRIGLARIQREDHTVVLTARQPKNEDVSLTWVASDMAEALPGLARKLPHYHKYSYLGFQGQEPQNIAKGRWPVLDSPMTVLVPSNNGTVSKVAMGKVARREPLATLPPAFPKSR